MGEYAKYRGEEVKIGTCEDMYYLRDSQRFAVVHLPGNVDPVNDRAELRFRFPWPDEDGIEPGSDKYHDNGFHRGVAVPGDLLPPKDLDHGTIQFTSPAGYVTSLPCPEGADWKDGQYGALEHPKGYRVHRNGHRGKVLLVATKYRPGIGLVPILMCGGCGAMYREEDIHTIEAIAVAFRSEGDKRGGSWYQTVADRLLDGVLTGETDGLATQGGRS